MVLVTFETFDPSQYQRVPSANLRSANKLGELLGIAEAELTARHRELAPAAYGRPSALDGGADVLWTLCLDRLEDFEAYEHVGFDVFIAKPETPLGQRLSVDRERAGRARVLRARLFADRVTFLKLPPREQAEHANSLLRLMKADDLYDDLVELVGPGLVDELFLIQPEYDAMVSDQLTNQGLHGQNLRILRLDCMRAISRYCIAVLDLLDEDQPKTLALVTTSLRPVVALRELVAAGVAGRSATDAAAEPELDPLVDEGVPSPEPVPGG
jgi:hypothetical protein